MRNISSSLLKFSFGLAFISLLLLPSLSCGFHPRYEPLPSVPNQSPLNDWLYRGAQPREEYFLTLKQKGIRTVVNFREEPKWIEWEKEKVEALGMNYVSLPWTITKSVAPELLDRFFEVLDNPKNRPLLFHCKHGRDRSGVMATLALMRYEKLSENEARGIALETIHPHLHYRFFVNQKINFFIKARPSYFLGSSSGGQEAATPPVQESVSSKPA